MWWCCCWSSSSRRASSGGSSSHGGRVRRQRDRSQEGIHGSTADCLLAWCLMLLFGWRSCLGVSAAAAPATLLLLREASSSSLSSPGSSSQASKGFPRCRLKRAMVEGKPACARVRVACGSETGQAGQRAAYRLSFNTAARRSKDSGPPLNTRHLAVK